MDNALDSLRERFGSKSVTRGELLGRRDGLQVPLLPD
jgi:DNA polymerase-4